MRELVHDDREMETNNRIVSEDDLDNDRCAVGDYVRLKHGLAVVTRTADMTEHGHIELFILFMTQAGHDECARFHECDYDDEEEAAPTDATLN